MIAGGKVGSHHGDGIGKRLQLIGLAPDDLPNIRILLMGHDTGTGGEVVGKRNESHVLAHEKNRIVGKLVQGSCHHR